MKKIICFMLAVVMLLSVMFGLSACGNQQLIDITYNFDSAIISLPDGTVVKGEVSSWKDYDGSDQLQVVVNGKTYLVHSSNVALISE